MPPATSSTRTSPSDRGKRRRQRCRSLDLARSFPEPVDLQPNLNRSFHTQPISEVVARTPFKRAPSSSRRRLHTETEVSSLLILEQLSSILNDDSAHLEGTVDVDLLSEEEMNQEQHQNTNATQSDGAVGVREIQAGGADVVSLLGSSTSPAMARAGTASLDALLTGDSVLDQVKQPLGNVDRYSMLGGQISWYF